MTEAVWHEGIVEKLEFDSPKSRDLVGFPGLGLHAREGGRGAEEARRSLAQAHPCNPCIIAWPGRLPGQRVHVSEDVARRGASRGRRRAT